jgi:hypothetical protein
VYGGFGSSPASGGGSSPLSAGDGPFFFLSYAHSPWDDRSRPDPDLWIGKLYDDLCELVKELAGLPSGAKSGFMDRDLRQGQEWPDQLANALASCRVFVPLYSHRYFRSEHCGKEWFAFNRRRLNHKAKNTDPIETIVPALWIPVQEGMLPVAAVSVQYNSRTFGELYAEHGFFGIMKVSRWREAYEEAVYLLARQIVTVGVASPLAPGEAVPYESLDSAFGGTVWAGPGDRPLRITIVAPSKDELPAGRDASYYGKNIVAWNPYREDSVRSLADHAAELARSLSYTPEVGDLFRHEAGNCDLLGRDDPHTLSSANNLAVDLRLVGDPFRARDLDQETLNRRQVVLGPEHPQTLHSAAMLARDLREAGDYQASTELLERTYQQYLSVLGEDFVDTLRTGKSFAVSLRKMGRLDEAYELTRGLDDRYVRTYGAAYPDSLACRLNLACDLSAQEEKAAAYRTAGLVLRGYEETLGRTHPFTLVAENNMSTYLRGIGSQTEALQLANETLSGMKEQLGEDHPFTLSCQVNMANCLHDLNRLADAESLLRDTVERLRKSLRDNHPDTLVCEANLAVVLRARGRADEAEALQFRVLSGLVQTLGPEHPSGLALRRWRLQNRDLEVQPT